MRDTSIYVETISTAPKLMNRKYGYVLECGETKVPAFGEAEGTYNQTILQALIDALKRFNKPARLELWIPNYYVAGMLANTIDSWKENDWKNAKGEDVDPRWKELYELLLMHEFAIVPGGHEYSTWMKSEMKRGEKDGHQEMEENNGNVSMLP